MWLSNPCLALIGEQGYKIYYKYFYLKLKPYLCYYNIIRIDQSATAKANATQL